MSRRGRFKGFLCVAAEKGSLVAEGVADEDRVLALWAGRNKGDGGADEFFDPAYILDRLGGELRPAARATGRFAPAVHALVDRLDGCLVGRVGREMGESLAPQPIAGADPDLVQTVEHVELGEGDSGDARARAGLADQNGVEPAAAALAAGDRAELAAALAEPLAHF